MTDRVDAKDNWIQATHREPMIYGVLPNPTLHQLPPRNHAVLPFRQIRDERIDGPAKPPQPAYVAG
jgi:hypothetical protein